MTLRRESATGLYGHNGLSKRGMFVDRFSKLEEIAER